MNKYQPSIVTWTLILLFSALAGFLGSQFLSPWLVNLPLVNKINWPGKAKETTTIVNKTEKIYLTEDLVYQDSIGRVLSSVVYLRAEKAGKILADSAGFILTSDGLVAATDLAMVKGTANFVVAREGKEYPAELIREDKENNLALFKIAENNLPVVSFGQMDNLKLGQRVFFPGADMINKSFSKFVLAGFIKTLVPAISFSLNEKLSLAGGPIINSQGEVLGLALIGKEGEIILVGEDKIRGLLN